MELILKDVSKMSKAPTYGTGPSKAVLAKRKQFEDYIIELPADQAGVLVLDTSLGEDGQPKENAKSVQMYLRRAEARLKDSGWTGKLKVVHPGDAPERVEFTVVAA